MKAADEHTAACLPQLACVIQLKLHWLQYNVIPCVMVGTWQASGFVPHQSPPAISITALALSWLSLGNICPQPKAAQHSADTLLRVCNEELVFFVRADRAGVELATGGRRAAPDSMFRR